MEPENDLAHLLKSHKRALRIGDKRLADLANDYAGVPLVNRSSVRNWSDGSAKVVRDWRPLAAIAAALRLDERDASTLLRAGDCPDISTLLGEHPDEKRLLRHWADARAQISHTEPESDELVTDPPVQEVPGNFGRDDHEGFEARTRPNRSRVGAMAALLGLFVVSSLVYVVTNRGVTSEARAANDDAPPVTEILTPAQGSVVGETLVGSGRSSHPVGVSHVDAVLVDIDRNIYWNPKDQVWQQEWRVFTVPASEQSNTEATWEVDLGDPVPLLPGNYRFRVWSRSKSNRGDPVGPLVEFIVSEKLETLDPKARARAEQLQNHPIPDPAFDLEASGQVPIARSRYPHNGSSVLDGFRLLSDAEYEPGLKSMSVELHNLDTGKYWNFEAERWQGTPIRYELIAREDDCGPCTELAYDVWMPAGSTPPGEYVLTTWAVGVDGATYPEGTTAEFSVIGP